MIMGTSLAGSEIPVPSELRWYKTEGHGWPGVGEEAREGEEGAASRMGWRAPHTEHGFRSQRPETFSFPGRCNHDRVVPGGGAVGGD